MNGHLDAYQSLAETVDRDEPRWAFGSSVTASGIVDTPVEIMMPVPTGAVPGDLAGYCQMLGDDALVCGHRVSEWVSNAPELEEEVALANIALDLLGQARALLARGGFVEGAGRDEDALAFWRDQAQFRNVALAELSDRLDFAHAVARLLVFSSWRFAIMRRLRNSTDPAIAAVAVTAGKELAYHRDYAVRWTLRLGDGTEESHRRMQAALDAVWPYVEELFRTSELERRLIQVGVAIDPSETRTEVSAVLDEVLAAATLSRPAVLAVGTLAGRGGRQGVHTEALGHLLAEMQSLARQHPGATW
ncbi:MAG: phenylacetate-CoA oxygenase subunit PaaC [Pseudonocardia sp.]|nr:phenylacetate-CoA oxygenase subunit PaaC [Pseudonocardia sp.]